MRVRELHATLRDLRAQTTRALDTLDRIEPAINDSLEGNATAAESGNPLEHAWQSVRQRHPDVPRVTILLVPATAYGESWPCLRWAEIWRQAIAANRLPEFFVPDSAVNQDHRTLLEHLMHQAAHALSAARGVTDCTDAGEHNERFLEAARELGLSPPQLPTGESDLSAVRLGQATATGYVDALTGLESIASAGGRESP